MTDAINSWNNVYSSIPDFKKYNAQFSLNKFSVLALGPILGLILSKDSQSLLNRACFWSVIGLTAVKGSLAFGAYIQGKVFEQTDIFAKLQQEQKELDIWGTLVPPTDPTITDCAMRYREMQIKLWNSFPYGNFFNEAEVRGVPIPKPEPYTLEKLETDCEQWMKDSLAIARAVREDLKKWSESGQFKKGDNSYSGGDLLVVQAGTWQFEPFSCPWLYKGAFRLPEAYRNIFNLPDCIAEFEREGYKEAEDKFAKTYPASNRQLREGWKEKFFIPGTKQYEWRQKYNEAMEAIFAQTGGIDKIPDERFVNWGRLHAQGDYQFCRSPGSKPN